MTRNLQFQLGPDSTAFQQGRSAHGTWRAAYRRAAHPDAARAAFALHQDADRVAFALAEGPAAEVLAVRLADFVWTREIPDAAWPRAIADYLNEAEARADVPPGLTTFLCGRLERAGHHSRVSLAWLGLPGARLYDRAQLPLGPEGVTAPGEGWTGEAGLQPPGTALHVHRSELRGVERIVLFSGGAAALGDEVVDLSAAELEQALEDWSAEAASDLLVYDLRLTTALPEPAGVSLTYYWTSPELCVLMWRPSAAATGYRVEQASEPTFAEPALLAELTDGRQTQYSFSPPTVGIAYYRVIPMSGDVAGPPSIPVTVMPMALAPPTLHPIQWSQNGGYLLTWTAIPQADAYEVQVSAQLMFEPETSYILYRGEAPELSLPPSTPPGQYYRVRALNTRYAPQSPSVWSRAERAPTTLPTPVFSEVGQTHIRWEPVPGAGQYEVRFRASGQPDMEWESLYTTEPATPAAIDQPTDYRVRALRQPNELHTASAWSAQITLSPPGGRAGAGLASGRMTLPLLLSVALVALIVGAALGLAGAQTLDARDPSHTPNLTATVRAAVSTALAGTLAAQPALTPDRAPGDGLATSVECIASPVGDTAAPIRLVAHADAPVIARFEGPLPVTARREVAGSSDEVWLRVWLEDQGRAGWVAADAVALSPATCAASLPLDE